MAYVFGGDASQLGKCCASGESTFKCLRRCGFACLLISLALLATRAEATNWTQSQGNAGHTGYVPGSYNPLNFSPLWHITAPAYSAGPGERGVAIDAHSVYATMLEGYGPSGNYHVVALDRLSGAEQWRETIGSSSHSGVSAPSLLGDSVYVHHWGHSGSSGSTYPDDYPALVALNKNNGDMQFWSTHSGQWSSGSRPTPIGDQVFAAGGYYGGINGYDAATGANWFTPLNQQYGWIPAADDTHVYVYMGEGGGSPGPGVGQLFAINRSGGVDYVIAHPESTGSALSRDLVVDGTGHALTIGRTDNGSTLVSFDLENRSIAWQTTGQFRGSMAVHDGQIVIANGQLLSVLDQTTGDFLWSWNAGTAVSGNVVLTDNLAFVNAGNSVVAIDLTTRLSVWSVPLTGELALANDVLVISNPQGINAFLIPEPSAQTLGIIAACVAGTLAIQRRRTRPRKLRALGECAP